MIKENIMRHLNEKTYIPSNKNKLYEVFKDTPQDEFEKALNELLVSFDIMSNKKGTLYSSSKAGYVKGIVTGARADMVFVRVDEEERDVKIDLFGSKRATVRYKDEVLLKKDGLNYELTDIIKHNLTNIVGEYKIDTIRGLKVGYFLPENKNYKIEFSVVGDDAKNLVDGHKVVFSLMDTAGGPIAKLEKIIGHKNDPGVDIETKIIEAEAPIVFSDATMREVEQLPTSIDKENYKNRLDLTDKILFTIDGADAKDLDDAVECYKLENGNYMLGVHIADVTNYVKEGSAMDIDAIERGTSIYLADRVVPMYPHKLSNGICSLNPHVDRLTMSCYMEIDSNGKVVSSSIKESIINSKKRFTYKEVNEILENDNPYVIEENKEFVLMLRDLHEVSKALRKNKDERGQIELDLPESKIIVDEVGKAIDIVLRERGEGERLIEDCMVAANESVAEAVSVLELPYLYRVHDFPDTDKIRLFSDIAKSMDVNVKYNSSMPIATYIKKVFAAADSDIKRDVLGSLFLRSLPKAIYDPINIGHFGLGSKCYTHFTSPIRRYPDTTVHRMLKKYIINQDYMKDDFPEKYYEEKMKEIGESTSSQERRAIQLERDVNDMKKAEYMESKIGEHFNGKVSGFIDKGLFVQLDNTVEGFINYNDLGDDAYKFNREKFQAEGKMNGKVIRIGFPMKIVVSSASKGTSKIDFKPTKMQNNNKKHNKRR